MRPSLARHTLCNDCGKMCTACDTAEAAGLAEQASCGRTSLSLDYQPCITGETIEVVGRGKRTNRSPHGCFNRSPHRWPIKATMRSSVRLMQSVVRVREALGSSPGTPTFLYRRPHGSPISRAVWSMVIQLTPGTPYRSTQGLFRWWFKLGRALHCGHGGTLHSAHTLMREQSCSPFCCAVYSRLSLSFLVSPSSPSSCCD